MKEDDYSVYWSPLIRGLWSYLEMSPSDQLDEDQLKWLDKLFHPIVNFNFIITYLNSSLRLLVYRKL